MPSYETRNRPLGTWVSESEAAMFSAICAHHNISLAAMLRALVIDCIAEEGHKVAEATVLRRKVVPANLFAAESITPTTVYQPPATAQQSR